MAGFEVVVRPVIFPDIRPRPKAALPLPDDPTKGFAVIKGNPAGSTSSSYSFSVSASYTRPREKQRRVDKVRIYQIEAPKGAADEGGGDGGGGGGGGGINRKNFVDVEVANRITMDERGGPVHGDVPFGEGGGGPSGSGLTTGQDNADRKYFYQRTPAADNIEILLRDQIRRELE